MKHKIYSVYDSKAGCYLPLFTFRSRGEAIRAFTETVNDSSSSIGKYPEDYTLFELGVFDDEFGAIDLLQTPTSVGLGIDFKRISN